ncbi:MAG TPA: bifunctional methylenetetrahydrofolate dehydrogenase/methenyltetrahydrofolate cyclohydrolase FolD [Arenicellales bacterium]|nr:bifunctional methylenetetrahydrofolate dehydrogenase/methenyltetrahydrofolate cyclohydrolase FolD [Arenicellales bacterium]
MSARILDGKAISTRIVNEIKTEVDDRRSRGLRAPGLGMILVGENPASQVYVRNKEKSCRKSGVESIMHRIPAETTQAELLALIDELNGDPKVDGILVQLPLPEHIDENAVIERISPEKDADGFHPYSMGRLALGLPGFHPCTPRGIMTLLAETGIDLSGKDAVIVGRSHIVGRPMALELISANATVTVCHSRTRDLESKVAAADIVVAAVGRAQFIRGEWIKPGAVVIDVGINRLDDGSLVGDVAYEPAAERASWITPVPGGVGPMTVASLLQNTLDSARSRDGA